MQQKTKLVSTVLLLAFSCFLVACSGSSANDDYVVKHNKKPTEEYSSTSGIEKKSLIDKSSLETLTDIVSEYSNSSEERDRVMTKIIELINTPYLWGGMSTNGI